MLGICLAAVSNAVIGSVPKTSMSTSNLFASFADAGNILDMPEILRRVETGETPPPERTPRNPINMGSSLSRAWERELCDAFGAFHIITKTIGGARKAK